MASNKPNKQDRELITRLADEGRLPPTITGKVQSVQCWKQGSFTIVRVVVGQRLGKAVDLVGVAKLDCNSDVDIPRRGRDIALARALQGDAIPDGDVVRPTELL